VRILARALSFWRLVLLPLLNARQAVILALVTVIFGRHVRCVPLASSLLMILLRVSRYGPAASGDGSLHLGGEGETAFDIFRRRRPDPLISVSSAIAPHLSMMSTRSR